MPAVAAVDMSCRRCNRLMTANSLAADDFDRPVLLLAAFLEPAHVWVMSPSPLPVHIYGTVYLYRSLSSLRGGQVRTSFGWEGKGIAR